MSGCGRSGDRVTERAHGRVRPGLPLVLVLLGSLSIAAPGLGQGVRGEAWISGSLLELRPLVRDSVPESAVEGSALRRRLEDGTIVSCVPGEFCRWFRPGDVERIGIFTQEVRAAGWTAVRGLSAHAHVRGRYGTDELWPRSNQEFEAVTAYVNYDAGEYRLRGGRQFRTDGLGYYNFDGLSVLWRGLAPLRAEAFGGWSLGRGLNAPRTGDLLAEADEFAPDERAYLLGAELSGRWGRRLAASAVYRREIRTDRGALYAERLAGDVRVVLGGATLDASVEYDLAFEEFNEARIRVAAPVGGGLHVAAEGRHHSPFFELWTIWGAFSPVGFTEGRGSVGWDVPETALSLEAGGGYRVYEETNAGADFLPIKDDGWRVFGNASWARDGWSAGGGYRAEIGFGAVRLGGDVRAGRSFGRERYLGLRGTSTQTFGEFRIGEQRVSGAAIEGRWGLGELMLSGSAGLYRLESENRPGVSSWNQVRGYLGLGYRFGSEPGGDVPTDGGVR